MKGSLQSSLFDRLVPPMVLEKATEMSSILPEAEMRAEAGRQDLGHFGSSNNNSSRKEKWYLEEEMEWREKTSKEKRNGQGMDPGTEENGQGKDPRTSSTWTQCEKWWNEGKMVNSQGQPSEERREDENK